MSDNGIRKRITKSGEIRYDAIWDEPRPDGDRQQRSKTFRTKRDARQFRTRILHEIHSGSYIKPSTTTVAEFLEEWLATTRADVQSSTLKVYAGIVRKHLVPALGGTELGKLQPLAIQRLFRRFFDDGAAPATVRLRHNVLHKALDQAVALQLVSRNPVDGLKRPTVHQPEVATWSAEEVRTFFAATAEDPRHVLWRLGFDSGMRLGELLALSWDDVDLKAGTVFVHRNLARSANGGWEIKDGTKTKDGRRTIALLPETVAVLGAHRAAQHERRLQYGKEWRGLRLVVDRGDGGHQCHSTVQKAFARSVKRIGLPRLTPHGMRHTMATLMAAAGVNPKVYQDRLGHASPEITLQMYTHVSTAMQRDGVERLAQMLCSDPNEDVRSA